MPPTTKRKSSRELAPVNRHIDHRALLARLLDREADAELFHGHHFAAERLARQAAALREVSR